MTIGTLVLLFFGGCLGGLLAGLQGVGGGLVFVLIFTNYLSAADVPDSSLAHLIVANSMFAIFFAGISGSIKHYFNGNFSWRPVLVTGLSASITSVLTAVLINMGTWYNKEIFALIFISLASYVAYRTLFAKEVDSESRGDELFSVPRFFIIGGLGGILAALSGIGGGMIMVPMLNKMLNVNIKRATAISLGVITIMSLASSAYAFLIPQPGDNSLPEASGLIVLPMVLPVAIGCAICSPFGVTISRLLSERTIKAIFAVFLLIVISNMIYNLWL